MKRFVLAASILLIVAAALWLYGRRDALSLQWDCYQVTSARSYEDLQQRIDLFQRESKGENRLAALVARWKTGNDAFDGYLARYLYDPQCSEALREAFSRELGWRKELIPAWGEHWRALKPDAEDRIDSLRRYLQALHAAEPPRELTWRDVLDFQAAVQLTGHGDLAHRLTPENWRERFERWEATSIDPEGSEAPTQQSPRRGAAG
jgi:hypothetical protein